MYAVDDTVQQQIPVHGSILNTNWLAYGRIHPHCFHVVALKPSMHSLPALEEPRGAHTLCYRGLGHLSGTDDCETVN